MFGHDLNPDYFINPPAYTYVLHALFTVRWGTDPASIGGAFAADPTTAFALARAASGFLGALAVALLAIAGARLFEDKRVGALAGALLAVAFLPVHYSHFALNDVPTLAPLARRAGRDRRHLPDRPHARVRARRAGAGRGDRHQVPGGDRARDAGRGGVRLAGRARPRAQPRARARAAVSRASSPPTRTRCSTTRRSATALEKQTETAGEEGGKLGLANTLRLALLPADVHLGLRLAAVAVRARRRGRAGGAAAPARDPARARAAAAVPLPGRAGALLRALDAADLPDPVPARGLRGGRARRPPARAPGARARRAVGRCCSRRGSSSASTTTVVLARADTRWVAREWMKANIPAGSNIVMEPIAPDQWAMDAGQPLFIGDRARATAGTSGARRARASSTGASSAPAPAR